MLEDIFELNIKLGEIEFEVTGTYTLELDEINVVIETTFMTLYIDNQETTIDAENILTSLDVWGKLEDEIIGKLKAAEEAQVFVNIDDVNEDDILGSY